MALCRRVRRRRLGTPRTLDHRLCRSGGPPLAHSARGAGSPLRTIGLAVPPGLTPAGRIDLPILLEPAIGLEPMTCRLRKGSRAMAAVSAHHTASPSIAQISMTLWDRERA